MAEDKAPHTEEQQTKPRRLPPWRPTRRQVLWAVGTLFTLVTIALLVALLVVNLDAVKWKDLLSRERIEQVALFIGIAVAVTTLLVLLATGGASLGWTGFADKTLWEWLQLLGALAIPLVLAIAGFWFTTQQEERQQRIETQRAASDRKIEEQRAQDAALQAYLDQMNTLLLEEKDLRNDRVRTLMRARTITVLGRLDPGRKTAVMQFLLEANLVQEVDGKAPIMTLSAADLSEANLGGPTVSPSGADLSGADLTNADLTGSSGATREQLELAGDVSELGHGAGRVTEKQIKQAQQGDKAATEFEERWNDASFKKGYKGEQQQESVKEGISRLRE